MDIAAGMLQIGAASACDLVVMANDGTVDPSRRATACFLIGELRLREAIPVLLDLARGSTDPKLDWAALCALGAIGSRAATRPLIRLLRHERSPVRRRGAVFALMQLSDERSRHTLMYIASLVDEQEATRGLAAEALGLLRRARCTSRFLVKLLRDASPAVRFGALCALAALGEVSAIHPIRRLVPDAAVVVGSETVGDRAAAVLEQLQHKVVNKI